MACVYFAWEEAIFMGTAPGLPEFRWDFRRKTWKPVDGPRPLRSVQIIPEDHLQDEIEALASFREEGED